MNEEMMTLGRRAVACKGWRWMPGMRRVWPFIVRKSVLDGRWSWLASDEDRARGFSESMPTERVKDDQMSILGGAQWDDATERWVACIPDLSDPATLGCLLALVREAFDSPGMCACMMQGPGEWMILLDTSNHVIGRTEAEALVAALEAAP